MSAPTFPILPGQGWSVHKKPKFATIVASHGSGREVRQALFANPLWEFELTFEALASDSQSHPGLQSQSLQAIMGLFLQCQGQFGSFYYFDPTDFSVATQPFGTGDGVTTTFQLTRTLGGFVEDLLIIFAPTTPILFTTPPGNGGMAVYAPNNLYANAMNLSAGFAGGANVTKTFGQTDPNGGTYAAALIETATTGLHSAQQGGIPISAGIPVTFSVYLQADGSRYQQLILDNVAADGLSAVFDLSLGIVSHSSNNGAATGCTATISPAGGGYFRCAVSGIVDSTATSVRASICGTNGSTSANWYTSYLGSTSNGVFAALPQVEQTVSPGAPGTFNPTLATRYFGGPSISAAGVYLDPTGYAIANGAVTFTTAPPSGATLTWSGYFAFLCRFLDDSVDFEQFMQNLWGVKSLKFQNVRSA